MNFRNFINEIQKKPRSTRLLILWLTTFLVMIIIVMIWIFSLSAGSISKESNQKEDTDNIPSLFENIRKDFSVLKQRLEASVKDINNKIEENAE